MPRYRGRRYHRSIGSQRALAHIEAARRLSFELGGADKDVKEYFFNLKPEQLEPVLVEYGIKFGSAAREYAESTISKWRSRRVQMSGEVASRLFALLPPRMPLETKYKLIEDLWKHVGPSSKKTIVVHVDTPISLIIEQAAVNIREVVTTYRIPNDLSKRFEWLSSGDARVKQELLSHFQTMEKELTVRALSVQLPVLVEHLRSPQAINTRRLAQIATVGKHEVEIILEREGRKRFTEWVRTPWKVTPAPLTEEVTSLRNVTPSQPTEGVTIPRNVTPTQPTAGVTIPRNVTPTQPTAGVTTPRNVTPSQPTEGVTIPRNVTPTQPTAGVTTPRNVNPTQPTAGVTTPRNVNPTQSRGLTWFILAVVLGGVFIGLIPRDHIAPATQPQITNPITTITPNRTPVPGRTTQRLPPPRSKQLIFPLPKCLTKFCRQAGAQPSRGVPLQMRPLRLRRRAISKHRPKHHRLSEGL